VTHTRFLVEFLYLADNKLDGELPFEIFSHLKELGKLVRSIAYVGESLSLLIVSRLTLL
jgi:hypothetical protein